MLYSTYTTYTGIDTTSANQNTIINEEDENNKQNESFTFTTSLLIIGSIIFCCIVISSIFICVHKMNKNKEPQDTAMNIIQLEAVDNKRKNKLNSDIHITKAGDNNSQVVNNSVISENDIEIIAAANLESVNEQYLTPQGNDDIDDIKGLGIGLNTAMSFDGENDEIIMDKNA